MSESSTAAGVRREQRETANPYPGLRPYDVAEAGLFFGREDQIQELLGRLRRCRFLAVVGSSGCGKSSLIRAGLFPPLLDGFLTDGTGRWRIAALRPGDNPIFQLANALARPDALGVPDGGTSVGISLLQAGLRRGSRGLVDAMAEAHLPAGSKLLILVDQFEELFRFIRENLYPNADDEAHAFVRLLLEAVQQQSVPVYVVLTMRSEFLGSCTQFSGLPEAINAGLYLVPRLTRDQLRDAIEGPVSNNITNRLVNQLLNDLGNEPDQLPILQHALMRIWNVWNGQGASGQIDLSHYTSVGKLEQALAKHLEELYAELAAVSGAGGRGTSGAQKITEVLFRQLTELVPEGRAIRRPAKLSRICAAAGAKLADVISVIEQFRAPGRSFLMPPPPEPLTPDTVIDISHESLIRQWPRLRDWTQEEARGRRVELMIDEAARRWEESKKNEGLLLTGVRLAEADDWTAMHHREASELQRDYVKASIARRDRDWWRKVAGYWAGSLLLLLAGAISYVAWSEHSFAWTEHDLRYQVQHLAASSERQKREAQAREAMGEGLALLDREPLRRDQTGAALWFATALGALNKEDDENLRSLLKQRLGAALRGLPRLVYRHRYPSPIVHAEFGSNGRIVTISLSKEGHRFLSSAADGSRALSRVTAKGADPRIYLWNIPTRGEPTAQLPQPASTGALSPNGKWAFFLGKPGTKLGQPLEGAGLLLRELASGNDFPVLPERRVLSASFSTDGGLLAIASRSPERGEDRPSGGTANPLPPLRRDPGERELVQISLLRLEDGCPPKQIEPKKPTDPDAGDALPNESRDWLDRAPRRWLDRVAEEEFAQRGTGESRNEELAAPGIWLSADNRTVVTYLDGRLTAWNAESGRQGRPLPAEASQVIVDSYGSMALAISAGSNVARLVDLTQRDDERAGKAGWLVHEGEINSGAFSADGRLVATCSEDRTCRVWDVLSGNPITSPLRHGSQVVQVSFSDDSRWLLTRTLDHTVLVWDLGCVSGPVVQLEGSGEIQWAMVSRNGMRVTTWSGDSGVALWQRETGRPAGQSIPGREVVPRSVAFSPDGGRVLAAFEKEGVQLYNLNHAPLAPLQLNHTQVVSAAFSHDSRLAMTGSTDGSVNVWNAETGILVRQWQHKSAIVLSTFSSTSNLVLTATGNGTVGIWDPETGDTAGSAPVVMDSEGKTVEVTYAALSPDDRLVVAGYRDGTARIWRAAGWEAVGPQMTNAGKSPVSFAAFDPTASLVLTKTRAESRVAVWDVKNRDQYVNQPLARVPHYPGTARRPSQEAVRPTFSADGKLVLTAIDAQTVQVWDARSGKPITHPLFYPGSILFSSLRQGANQSLKVLTVGRKGTIREWELLDDSVPNERLADHVQLLSSANLAPESGTFNLTPLKPDDLDMLAKRLGIESANLPTMAEEEIRAWHERSAVTNEESENQLATEWHLRALLKKSSNDVNLLVRLTRAVLSRSKMDTSSQAADNALAEVKGILPKVRNQPDQFAVVKRAVMSSGDECLRTNRIDSARKFYRFFSESLVDERDDQERMGPHVKLADRFRRLGDSTSDNNDFDGYPVKSPASMRSSLGRAKADYTQAMQELARAHADPESRGKLFFDIGVALHSLAIKQRNVSVKDGLDSFETSVKAYQQTGDSLSDPSDNPRESAAAARASLAWLLRRSSKRRGEEEGHRRKVLEFWEGQFAERKTADNGEKLIDAEYLLGESLVKSGKTKEARACLKAAVAMLTEVEGLAEKEDPGGATAAARRSRSRSHRSVAILSHTLWDNLASRDHWLQTYDLCKESATSLTVDFGQRENAAEALEWLADVRTALGENVEAMTAGSECVERRKLLTAGERAESDLALGYEWYAMAEDKAGYRSEAIKLLKNEVETRRGASKSQPANLVRRYEWAAAIGRLGGTLFAAGDLVAALEQEQTRLEMCKKLTDEDLDASDFLEAIAFASDALSRLYLARGELGSALEHQTKAREIWKQLSDRRNEALSIGALAQVQRRRGDYGLARSLLDDALVRTKTLVDSDAENVENLRQLGGLLRDRSEVYFLSGELPRARACSDEAVKRYQEIEPFCPKNLCARLDIANAWLSSGILALRFGDLESARSSFGKSEGLIRDLATRFRDNASAVDSWRSLSLAAANLAVETNDFKTAQLHLDKALELSQRIHERAGERDVESCAIQSECYRARGLLLMRQGQFTKAGAEFRLGVEQLRESGVLRKLSKKSHQDLLRDLGRLLTVCELLATPEAEAEKKLSGQSYEDQVEVRLLRLELQARDGNLDSVRTEIDRLRNWKAGEFEKQSALCRAHAILLKQLRAGRSGSVDDAERKTLQEKATADALNALEAAIKSHRAEIDTLLSRTDLDSIRGDQRYKRILSELVSAGSQSNPKD